MAEKDYLANLAVEPGDKLDHGIVGMKWGVRRSSAQLRTEAAKRKAAPSTEKKSSASDAQKPGGGHGINSDGSTGKQPASNIQDRVESSATRYARLASQAKLGRASEMTEQDLKFFNARTDALAKINKMNESDPGWLSKTSKKVLQTSAERSLQSVSDAVASKYLSGPIIDAINKKSA